MAMPPDRPACSGPASLRAAAICARAGELPFLRNGRSCFRAAPATRQPTGPRQRAIPASGRQADAGARARAEVDAAGTVDPTRHGRGMDDRHLRSRTGSVTPSRRGVGEIRARTTKPNDGMWLAANCHATAFAHPCQLDVDATQRAIVPRRNLRPTIGKTRNCGPRWRHAARCAVSAPSSPVRDAPSAGRRGTVARSDPPWSMATIPSRESGTERRPPRRGGELSRKPPTSAIGWDAAEARCRHPWQLGSSGQG